jgi:hypothetical protein
LGHLGRIFQGSCYLKALCRRGSPISKQVDKIVIMQTGWLLPIFQSGVRQQQQKMLNMKTVATRAHMSMLCNHSWQQATIVCILIKRRRSAPVGCSVDG